ncbi:hypothetical protein [Kitasatospora sp. NPDC092286]|uniref:hypothetical protein n=1 Tax=Kitasatospora sp. NPDC092286 TaxID=3364087 RepID=UPI00382EB0F7
MTTATGTTRPVPVLGDEAARLVQRTGIPVLLLAGQPGEATLSATIDGDPRRYTATTATYPDGLRTEVHAPGAPDPEQLVRRALPGSDRTSPAYLATPGAMTLGVEARHDGLMARAGVWNGWTLLTVTADTNYRGPLPALRLIGAGTLPTGRPGRAFTGRTEQ